MSFLEKKPVSSSQLAMRELDAIQQFTDATQHHLDAEHGDAKAQFAYGACLQHGRGVKKMMKRRFSGFEKQQRRVMRLP